jgi:hypothetical protein
MDMTIAKWHISVHRDAEPARWARPTSEDRAERQMRQSRAMAEHEQQRAKVDRWFLLNGGR